ncbi:MAG TPA: transporter substrate-binding domain-containing protein [Actinomycetota bacterium]|nr:transporter substrate-binding domain-containing protein [Actinomycetota bacterium]
MFRPTLVVLAVSLAACGLPKDPEGTLERVRGGVLRVGAVENPPWASSRRRPVGIDVELVERLAADLDADVRWRFADAEELFRAVEVRALDLVVGGIVADDPWVPRIGASSRYAETHVVIAAPAGMPVPADIEGRRVAVPFGSETVALVEEHGGVPVPVEDVTGAEGLVAIEEWALDDLALQDTGIVLDTAHHVMAVAPGENAFLRAVDTFLLGREALISRLVEEAGAA